MDEDFLKQMREQERILGEMRDNAQSYLDDLIRDALDPESFLRYTASLGINFSQATDMVGRHEGFNPYLVLGLKKTATDDEVKKRYREMLFKFHPDTAGAEHTEPQFQSVVEAFKLIAKERRWNN